MGGGGGGGVDGRFDKITVCNRKDRPEQTVWTKITLFATHPAILHTRIGSKWTC